MVAISIDILEGPIMEKTDSNQQDAVAEHDEQTQLPTTSNASNPMKAVQTTAMPVKIEFAQDQSEKDVKSEGD